MMRISRLIYLGKLLLLITAVVGVVLLFTSQFDTQSHVVTRMVLKSRLFDRRSCDGGETRMIEGVLKDIDISDQVYNEIVSKLRKRCQGHDLVARHTQPARQADNTTPAGSNHHKDKDILLDLLERNPEFNKKVEIPYPIKDYLLHQAQEVNATDRYKPGWWKRHIQTTCGQLGFNTSQDYFPPVSLNKMLVDDQHKLVYCQIAKVASTNLGKIFAILSGKSNSSDPGAIASDDVHHSLNKLQVHMDTMSLADVRARVNSYFTFLFVRDPFERLVSGYINKFLRPAAGYFQYLNKKLVRIYRKDKTNKGVLTFPEFVTYLVDQDLRRAPMNGHWQPYYELCSPCKVNYDFVGKLTSYAEDLGYILQVNDLTESISLPNTTVSRAHTFHKTDLFLKQYYSQLPKDLMLKLYDMYAPDYKLFDFALPTDIRRIMESW